MFYLINLLSHSHMVNNQKYFHINLNDFKKRGYETQSSYSGKKSQMILRLKSKSNILSIKVEYSNLFSMKQENSKFTL